MKIEALNRSPNFGWSIKTHFAATEEAAKSFAEFSSDEIKRLARYSQLPDLMKEELGDGGSAHFYDILSDDPSFGVVNDEKNNAYSKFMEHTKKALEAKERETFLREVGFATHFLQDAGTPPHVEHGNYFHKIFRVPMHMMFEKGEKVGANARLDELKKNYVFEKLPVSTITALFHNTALHSVQPENLVTYTNLKDWFSIQSRCYNRSVNASKAYLDWMIKHLPKKVMKVG